MPLCVALQSVFFALSVTQVHSPAAGTFTIADVDVHMLSSPQMPVAAGALAGAWPVVLVLVNDAVCGPHSLTARSSTTTTSIMSENRRRQRLFLGQN